MATIGHDDQGRTKDRAGQDPDDGAQQLSITPAGKGIEDEVQSAHDEVGDAEDDPVGVEGMRGRQRHDEHRGHRPEYGDPDGALFGVQRVGEPGVRCPRPPERGEEERAAQQAIPGQVRGEEAGDLSDGEHEDEIEEELERGHPQFGFVLSLMHLASPVVLRAAYPRSSHDDHHREPSQEHHPWAS
jgi:hypothetical protein